MIFIVLFLLLFNNLLFSQNLTNAGKLLWNFSMGYKIFSSPSAYNNKLYVAVKGNKFICLNILTGNVIWEYNTEITNNYFLSSPFITNNNVYLSSILDKKIRCFDAEKGKILWEIQLNTEVESGLKIFSNKLFFGANDGKLYCLNVENRNKEWEFQTSGYVKSTPYIYNNKIYFGSYDKKFYCLDINNGQKVWDFNVGGEIYSSPICFNDKVYFGSYDYCVYCLSANDGKLIWKFNTSNMIISSPAIYNNKLYIGTYNNLFYCLDINSGNIIWSYKTGDVIDSSPSIINNEVFFGCYDYKIYCLDSENGNLKWFYTGDSSIETSPIVYDGILIIGNDNGNLYAIDTGIKGTYAGNSIGGQSLSLYENLSSQSNITSSYSSQIITISESSSSSEYFSEKSSNSSSSLSVEISKVVSSYSSSSSSYSLYLENKISTNKIETNFITSSSSSILSNYATEFDIESGITNYVVVTITNYVFLLYPDKEYINRAPQNYYKHNDEYQKNEYFSIKRKNNYDIKMDEQQLYFTIQVGAYQNLNNALKVYEILKNKNYKVYITEAIVDGKTFYRIRIGYYFNEDDAKNDLNELIKLGFKGVIFKVNKNF